MVLASPGFLAQSNEAISDKADILDLAARSNVMISSLNARGLFTIEMDASQQGASSQQAQQLISQYYRDSAIATETCWPNWRREQVERFSTITTI